MGDRLATIYMGRKVRAAMPLWPGPRPTSVPSGILIHLAVWAQQTWAKKWGLLCPLLRARGAGSTSHTKWRRAPLGEGAEPTSNTKSPWPRPISLPSGILIYAAIWPQRIWAENWGGGCALLGEGELGPHLTQCGQGRGLPA